MTTIGIEGGLGSGKTLLMTFFLYAEQHKLQKRIFANYKLNFLYEVLDMNKVLAEMGELQNVAIGIDEFHIFADSRMSASKRNRMISYFALQTRKRNVSLYFTSQFLDQVEKRLRRLVDYRIICEQMGKDWFKYTLIDLTGWEPRMREFRLKGDKIFDLYSTDEIVDIV